MRSEPVARGLGSSEDDRDTTDRTGPDPGAGARPSRGRSLNAYVRAGTHRRPPIRSTRLGTRPHQRLWGPGHGPGELALPRCVRAAVLRRGSLRPPRAPVGWDLQPRWMTVCVRSRFVLEKTPSRHSPSSSRKRGGSGNPGTLLKWIPAFAGMTACVRESGERGAGNLKKTIGAIPSRSTLPVDIVYVDPYFSRKSGCRHLRAAWPWPDASTGYSHPGGAGRRPRFARW